MQIPTNGIHLEVSDEGRTGGETVLLIMGLGMQLIAWPPELVDDLLRRGYRVIRIDNRDAGLSAGFDSRGVPNMVLASLRYAMNLEVPHVYRLADMARDCLGVLDALGVRRAHVCGASMGGMIAQHLAASHPERVASLTLVMTTSGARHLPQPGSRVKRMLMRRVPASAPPEAVAAHLERLLKVIGSPSFPPDPLELRGRLVVAARRAWRPHGTARQLLAVAADGDRSALLRRIQAPVHIVHGLADALVPVEAARDLHAKLPGSTIDLVTGMGHDLPRELMPRLAAGIAENMARAAARATSTSEAGRSRETTA
jgi:pimeloyl-ACP methyl ester carboxylesterase